MGYVSNQWLNTGYGLRNRSYSPVSVKVSAERTTSQWATSNRVVAEIKAYRGDGQCQIISVTRREAKSLIRVLVGACGEELRADLATRLLNGMSDADLLNAVANRQRRKFKV